jgi:hypothetical protein
MTFNQEDLEPLKEAYNRALMLHNHDFTYKGQQVPTSYAKYCIEYLHQPVEEVEIASRMSEAVNLLKKASNDMLAIIHIPVDQKTLPVLCLKVDNKLEPLFLGINSEQLEQILKHKLP